MARPRDTELHYSRLTDKDEKTTLCRLERVDIIDDLLRVLGVFDDREDVLRPAGDVVDVLATLRRHEVAVGCKVDTRSNACWALGYLAAEDALERLRNIEATDSNEEVRHAASVAIDEIEER